MTSRAQDQDPSALGRVDMSKPSPARIWNCFLGGKDNFAVDREAAASAAEAMPFLPEVARQVRSFQGDVVRRLVARGVRQFLDIGTGLPVAGSVHEVAQQEAPESRVVYADNDHCKSGCAHPPTSFRLPEANTEAEALRAQAAKVAGKMWHVSLLRPLDRSSRVEAPARPDAHRWHAA